MALKNYKSFLLLEEYLNYLLIIKGRSQNTIVEYRNDLLMFFDYLNSSKGIIGREKYDVTNVDINYIKGITLSDMYAFISHCQTKQQSAAGTRSRKIVSIRQFWKYLRTKAHVIESNVAEELETPKIPQRIPKYLSLEESVRLLMVCEKNPRDHCIITIFLNCALRLSELISLDVDQVSCDVLTVIGKGNKERQIFLTPAVKKAIIDWMELRKSIDTKSTALFVTKNNTRITGRAVQDIVKKYIVRAGLDPNKISVHKLRHTAATLMYQYGHVDIRALQQILGHDSISTTQIYTHSSNDQLERAVNSNPLATMFGIK